MSVKNTDELQKQLQSSIDLNSFLSENDEAFHDQSVAQMLSELIARRELSKAALARQAGMSEVYLYQILSGHRMPSRNRLLCLGVGTSCSLEEVQELLKRCGYASLYAKNRRDSIIMYGFAHGQNLVTINDNLFMAREETLS